MHGIGPKGRGTPCLNFKAMENSDRVLLSGIAVEVLSLLLTGLFGWIGVDVPLIGFEDRILQVSEVLRLVGLVIIFFSDRFQASVVMYRAERRAAKAKKYNG